MRRDRILAAAATALAVTACASSWSDPAPTATGQYLAATYAARTHKLEDAARAFAAAHSEDPASPDLTQSAFLYHVLSGDVAGSLEFARASMKSQSVASSSLERLTLAVDRIRAGDYAAARALLAGAGDDALEDAAARLLVAWAIDGADGPDAALDALDSAGKETYRGFNAFHRALISERAGKINEARASFKAATAGGSSTDARLAYGAFLEREGPRDDAIAYYKMLSAQGGLLARGARTGLARLEKNRRPPPRVTPRTGAALALADVATGLYQQALMEQQAARSAGYIADTPRIELPLTFAQLSLYADPKIESARYIVASAYAAYGMTGAAEREFRSIARDGAYGVAARQAAAEALIADGQTDKAIDMLRDLSREGDAAPSVGLRLGDLLTQAGEYDEAVATLTSALDAMPEDEPGLWRYRLARGAAYLQSGDWAQAEPDLKAAADLAPDEPYALNYLGYSWAERGENLPQAFELLERALKLNPDDAAIIDSMGWAHYQLRQYDKAISYLEKAVGKAPNDPTITDHLGDAYWRAGRRTEARYEWDRALMLEPADDLRAKLKTKLDEGLAPNHAPDAKAAAK